MSGHSKWSTIKRKKAATDEKRGKLFAKLIALCAVFGRLGLHFRDGRPQLLYLRAQLLDGGRKILTRRA